MVRKQIDIQAEQDRRLKQRAKELGVTESELIRQGIDRVDQAQSRLPLDQTAWEEELKFIHERAQIQGSGSTRKWTREELYKERPSATT